MWQHVKLSEQICPWDTLACCWDVEQPTNKWLQTTVCARTKMDRYQCPTDTRQHVSLVTTVRLPDGHVSMSTLLFPERSTALNTHLASTSTMKLMPGNASSVSPSSTSLQHKTHPQHWTELCACSRPSAIANISWSVVFCHVTTEESAYTDYILVKEKKFSDQKMTYNREFFITGKI